MRKRLGAMALSLFILSGAPGWAAEIEGTVRSVDTAARLVQLEDGTQLWAQDGLTLDVVEGARIKASYEERDGKNVMTSLETAD